MTDNYETTDTTSNTKDEIISTLNGLINTCKDGEEGFKTAAESVKNPTLKSTFQQLSRQRLEFADALRHLVTISGGNPDDSGTIAGALHRGWLNIKAAVTGGDETAILEECERGEDAAKEAYQNAMEKALPVNAKDIVGSQAALVLEAHRKIKALRDEAKNAAGRSANA